MSETLGPDSQGWQMRAVLRIVDRREVRGGRRVGLRDAALLLLRAARITPTEVSRLRGRDIEQDASGRVFVCVRRHDDGEPSLRRVRVPDVSDAYVHGILLDYLEAERLWGRPDPLFCGRAASALSPSAIRMIEQKYRRRLACR